MRSSTREYTPAGWTTIEADFREYTDPFQSSLDWWRLMQSPLYADVLAATSADEAAEAVARAGYATDPDYAIKLKRMTPRTPEQVAFFDARKADLAKSGAPPVLVDLGARQSALETGWGRSAPGGNLYGIKAGGKPLQVARAGRADISSGLLSQALPDTMKEADMPQSDLMGESTLARLMQDPMFLMGAAVLSQSGGATGDIGRGLLGGTAAYEAQRQNRSLEQYRQQQLKAQQNPRSANIAEYEYLRQQGVPHDQAMRYSFAGNAGYGERGMMMGNVPMVQVTNPDGTTSIRPMAPQELDYRRGVIEEEKRTASTAEGLGKQTAELRAEINKAATVMPSLIKQTDQLIADIKGGKYQDTGPIKGRITEYWSPEIADLQFKATEQVLQNLQIVNLAPVTIKELELMGQLYAGAYKTPEQNLAVLEYLNGRAKERLRRMRKLDAKLRGGGKIEDLPQWVDVADDQWQELLRLRGMTGGR